LKKQSATKSPVKPTSSKKMTVLTPFLESSFNFQFNNLKKYYKIWFNRGEKHCQTFNCQEHSLKKQSATKSPVKPTSSKKMTVLSPFLETSFNFQFNNLKKLSKFGTVRENAVSNFQLPET